MDLVLVGLSHKTAPVEIRERVAFSDQGLEAAVRRLRDEYGLAKSLILSTCNRVEVLAHDRNLDRAFAAIQAFLHHHHSLQPAFLDRFLYRLRGPEAIRHVFRVASSLDSMVVGESQILGQLKQAYEQARLVSDLGELERLLTQAFFVAKKVRRETRIGLMPVSVSSVAVELSEQIFGCLQGKSVLLIGAGAMAEQAAQNLTREGTSKLFVTNRTLEHSQALANRLKGQAVPFDRMEESLVQSDVVLVSTGADHYLLRKALLEVVIRKRKYRPLFLIDISVPRNVDPSIHEIENVFLFDIDDLQNVVDSNLQQRQQNAREGEQIVDEQVERFLNRVATERVAPLIRALRERFEELCLQDLITQAQRLDPSERERLEKRLKQSAHRMAHPLILEIKRSAGEPGAHRTFDLIRRVFRLDEKR